jgi:hypothetical protein
MATIRKTKKQPSIGKNMKKLECLCSLEVNAKWCSHYGKQYGVPQSI